MCWRTCSRYDSGSFCRRMIVAILVSSYAPSHCRTLELLTAEKTVTKLDEAHIIFRHLLDKMARCVNLAQRQLVVVLVVKYTGQQVLTS